MCVCVCVCVCVCLGEALATRILGKRADRILNTTVSHIFMHVLCMLRCIHAQNVFIIAVFKVAHLHNS